VPDLEVSERGHRRAPLVLRPPQRTAACPEDLVFREHDEPQRRDREPARAFADHDREALLAVERWDHGRFELMLAQDVVELIALTRVAGDEPDAEALLTPALELGAKLRQLARVAGHRVRVENELTIAR